MGGPQPTPPSLDGRGAPKGESVSSTMKPEQYARGERARWSIKPVNLKVDVENLEEVWPTTPDTILTSPIEKYMVDDQRSPFGPARGGPAFPRRNSATAFLQPDQFITELKVKTGAVKKSDLSVDASPRSARTIRRSTEPPGEAPALEPASPHLRKSLHVSNGKVNVREGTKPVSQRSQVPERETKSRGSESSGQQLQTVRAGRGLESFFEPANSVPRLELSYEGKPAPAPAHLRARTGTGTGTGQSANSQPLSGKQNLSTENESTQPSLDNNSEEVPGVASGAVDPQGSSSELQKSASEGSGRSLKSASPALQKLQATSGLLGTSCSPGNVREKLVRSLSAKKESSSRGGESRTAHSFHGVMPTSSPSEPNKLSSDVEGNLVKRAGRLRRMLHWGASRTGSMEILKSLERKLGKKSSKVSSGSKNEKNEKISGGKDGSKAEPRIESFMAEPRIETPTAEQRIEAEREQGVGDRAEKLDPDTLDEGMCSPRSSASSVSTTYSEVSSKSHSYKHSHHKKNVKTEIVKSKLWLLRVHQKMQGRPSKEAEDDSDHNYEPVRGATFHGTTDTTFKDGVKKTLTGSARFNLDKNAISKLVTKHRRNSTWDAGKLSPTADHLFSPKQPRLHTRDAQVLLTPPRRLTGDTLDTEFQRRRGNPIMLNTRPRSMISVPTEVKDTLPSPRKVAAQKEYVPVAPENQVATSAGVSLQTSQTNYSTSTRQQQGLALPALSSQQTLLKTVAVNPTSPRRTELPRSAKNSVQNSVSPGRAGLHTPPISPGTLPPSQRSSFGGFPGFNSPLPLPVRVGTLSSPTSPIYAASPGKNFSKCPGRYATSPSGEGMLSSPTSPGLFAPSPGWTERQSTPTSPGVYGASPTSPGLYATGSGGGEYLNSLNAGLDATFRMSPRYQGLNAGEDFLLEDSTRSTNSSLATASLVKHPATRDAQQESKVRSRSDAAVARNGAGGPKPQESTSPAFYEKDSSDKHITGSGSVLPLHASPRPHAVSFEQIVAGCDHSPPTDNTLMKFFFKCREIEHLNKFLALQKKRFLESFNTDSEKRFHMILSEAGQGMSSMISTLCTAWLLENTMASASVKWHPIPVMNMSQKEMWQHRDAAWLFHVCGIEATAVLFLDEITSSNETVVAGRVKRAVTGQDILVTKDEVASSCTIVSEKFRQEAPKLLQARFMKTLLLAGILVDTKNLSTGSSRDKQQATILLVGAGSLGRNGFYKHLMNIRDESYVTTFIKDIYGDSNALTGDKPAPKGQAVDHSKARSAHALSDERIVRPVSLAMPRVSSEFSAPISSAAPAFAAAKLSRKSECDGDSKGSSKAKEGSLPQARVPPNSKISLAFRRLRNRSTAQ